MSTTKKLSTQKKLKLAGRLMEFLEKEAPANKHGVYEQLEVLLLAYHASSSADHFKRSFS